MLSKSLMWRVPEKNKEKALINERPENTYINFTVFNIIILIFTNSILPFNDVENIFYTES